MYVCIYAKFLFRRMEVVSGFGWKNELMIECGVSTLELMNLFGELSVFDKLVENVWKPLSIYDFIYLQHRKLIYILW